MFLSHQPSVAKPPRALQLQLRREIGPFERFCPELSQVFRTTQLVGACGILLKGPQAQPSTRPRDTCHSGRKCKQRLIFIPKAQLSLQFRPSLPTPPAPFLRRHSMFGLGGGLLSLPQYTTEACCSSSNNS